MTDTERLILVDDRDREIGAADKLAAHENGGRLHRAFSIFIRDDDRRVLMQLRAGAKYHFGGLWTNACCGHPRPGEPTIAAAQRRLAEEMAIRTTLREIGSFRYEARDEPSGLTEREIDHVLLGRFSTDPTPDPAEADDWRWIEPESLDRELRDSPDRFTPWLSPAWRIAREGL